MVLFDTPELRRQDWLTAAAFNDPQPGDHFHEMCSWHVFVIAVTPAGRVLTCEASGPCTLPEDGRFFLYPPGQVAVHYEYSSIPAATR